MGVCSSIPEDLEPYFQRTPFFVNLELNELRLFAHAFKWKRYKKGKHIIGEGDEPTKFFVIAEGLVEIFVKQDDGTVSKVCTKASGDFFGERFFEKGTDQKPYSASVVADPVDGATMLVLDMSRFTQLKKKHPRITEKVLETVEKFKIEDMVAGLELSNGLDRKDVKRLSSMCKFRTLKKDSDLFREGDVGNRSLYVVCTGTVKGYADKGGEEVFLVQFGPGQGFGEISVLCNMPRTATIRAASNCLLLELRQEDFARYLALTNEKTREHLNLLAKARIANSFKKYKVSFFESIPDDKYVLLAKATELEQFGPNEDIFKEGERGDKMYLIAAGSATAKIFQTESQTWLGVQELHPGSYFGEISLVRDCNRTATVTTNKHCVMLSISKEKFDEFFAECPRALVDFQIKLARTAVKLHHLIYHPLGLSFFEKYLQKEHSAENLHFWMECRDFSAIDPDDSMELSQMASQLVKKYVSATAENQVNLKSDVVQEILGKLKTPGGITPLLFKKAQLEVLQLMDKDSYARFQRSELFQEFLDKVDAYKDYRLSVALQSDVTIEIDEDAMRAGSMLDSGGRAIKLRKSGRGSLLIRGDQKLLLDEQHRKMTGGNDDGVELDLYGADDQSPS